MKINLKLITSIVLLAGVILLAGCRKGDPGPAGQTGNVGNNGAGYDDAVKNGNIVVYLSGKKPDGTVFKDTINFKYSAGSVYKNYFYVYNEEEAYVNINRYRAFNDEGNDDYIYFYLDHYIDSETSEEYYFMDTYLNANITAGSTSYFEIYDEFYSGEGSNVENFEVSDKSLDTSTGAYKAKVHYTVDGEQNDTGFDLDVTLDVNVTVYENNDD